MLMNYVSIFMVFYAFATITLMVSYGMDQEIIYFDERFSEEGIALGMSVDTLFSMRQDIEVRTNHSLNTGLSIPVDDLIQENKINVENDYINRRLVVKIEGNYQKFYEGQVIQDNGDYINHAHLFASEEYTYLVLTMNELKEHVISYKNKTLSVRFYDPKELYDNIIVIDPAFGGEEDGNMFHDTLEKDITLAVALQLKERLSDTDYKVYYTRVTDEMVSNEDRIRLINESMADFVIRIGVDYREDEEIYGASAIYHDEYFIPGFDSVQLSDLILQNVASKTGTQALGLWKASELEDEIIMKAHVPITAIQVGCVTNYLECQMLIDERYINQIASGIMTGIIESFQIVEGSN